MADNVTTGKADVKRADVIVAGLGAMGSAAAWQLARRGLHVLGLDRHDPPHTLGSTHGRTRIIREAYFEHPTYVPFVRRAYQLWAETEQAAGERLLLRTGGLMIGPPDGEILSGSLRSAREHDVPHELLSATDVRRQFPALRPRDDMVALLEHRAGILFPEAIVAAQLALAAQNGAELRTNERVVRWDVVRDHVRVHTERNEIEAGRLVLAAGPWMPELLAGYGVPLRTERQATFWFSPVESERFAPDEYPIALWDDPGRMPFYTFPDLGDGVKIAIHHGGVESDPDTMERDVNDDDERAVRDRLARYVPAANGELRDASTCIYTNTPDDHFIIDYLDETHRVVVLSPCSGHGFKFASAIGEAAACLATDWSSPTDLSLFRLDRFQLR